MAKETLRQRLAAELDEYLADLRDIGEGLKHMEGWIALALVITAILMTCAWVIISLGFSPANEHVLALSRQFGVSRCRPIDNFSGVIMIVDLIMLIFLTVISLGNIINMSKRARRNLPRRPRDLIVSTSLMLLVGIGGIVFMLQVC